MTQMHESDPRPQAASPYAAPDESPQPVRRPYVHNALPPKGSRGPLIFVALSVLVLIGGMAFWSGSPDHAEAENVAMPVTQMTAEQLAEKASPAAARELVRRLLHGTEAENASAAAVMSRPRSPPRTGRS